MGSTRPVHLVVGVDFGMTCTGVAYSDLKLSSPRVLQKWPGRQLETNNKVPSSLSYWNEGDYQGTVQNWGFKAQNVDGTKEWFKRYLDPAHIAQAKETVRKRYGPGSHEERQIPDHDEVKRWFKDYMECLYTHLSQEITGKTGAWEFKRVQFILSLPCTFRKQSVTKSILALVIEAGFGSGGNEHTVELGLSEPEAAAVFAIGQSAIAFQEGMRILVCDAGGGTTDLAVLQTNSKANEPPTLDAIVVNEGKNAGSTNIDAAFEKLVEHRLSSDNLSLPDNTAWIMMHSQEYLVWKCTFGQEDNADLIDFPVTVPGVQSDFESARASILNGKMRFTRQDFRKLFDPEIEKLIELITSQLGALSDSSAPARLDYIVLSGGLGSSAYVKSKLRAKFERRGGTNPIQILSSEEPQLSVVNGLVFDRIQRLKTGNAVIRSRKCPASYGVCVNSLYNDKLHVGQEAYKGLDGQKWVKDQMLWLVTKGSKVDNDEVVTRGVSRFFTDHDTKRRTTTAYYVSYNDVQKLPTNARDADAQYLCKIDFDLTDLGASAVEEKKKPRSGMQVKREKYYEAKFDIKMIIGPTDLKFEVWCKDKNYGEDHVTIDWD